MRRTLLIVVLLLTPPAATIGLTKLIEQRRFPRRFAEVVPGRMFRGGFPSAEEARHLKDDRGVKTLVSLTGQTDDKDELLMLDTARRLGIKTLRFPMPGDGRADFEQLDRAARAVAEQQDWPVFFHCAAGKQRSNATLAAYRLGYCGWSVEEALSELENHYDLDPEDEKALCDHLRAYARWLRTRPPAVAAQTSKTRGSVSQSR